MKFIAKNGPVNTDSIIKHIRVLNKMNRETLVDAGLIVKEKNGWMATNIGKSLLALMDYEEEGFVDKLIYQS